MTHARSVCLSLSACLWTLGCATLGPPAAAEPEVLGLHSADPVCRHGGLYLHDQVLYRCIDGQLHPELACQSGLRVEREGTRYQCQGGAWARQDDQGRWLPLRPLAADSTTTRPGQRSGDPVSARPGPASEAPGRILSPAPPPDRATAGPAPKERERRPEREDERENLRQPVRVAPTAPEPGASPATR
jgi:hypothetical protein